MDLVNRDDHQSGPNADFEAIRQDFTLKDNLLAYNNQDIIIPVRKSPDEILDSLNFDPQLIELIKSGSSNHTLTIHKIEFIKAALSNKYTIKEIGEYLSISQGALGKFVSRHNIAASS